MIETPQAMRAMLQTLATSSWTLGAISVLFDSGLAAQLLEPRTADALAAHCTSLSQAMIERCLAVAVNAGVVVEHDGRYQLGKGAAAFAQPPGSVALTGDMRATLMQVMAFSRSAQASTFSRGWSHTDPALLQAQGDASTALVGMVGQILPTLGDLAQRFARPGARFLDVGSGVAALAIAMCRTWPELHVVGLDPFDAPQRIARENVTRAGLTERIELRPITIEALQEKQSFDLVWLPSFFIPESALTAAIERAHAALRPGGFILFCVLGSAGQDPAQRAVSALINQLWGGPLLTTTEVEARLSDAGYAAVRTLPNPSSAPGMVVGQR